MERMWSKKLCHSFIQQTFVEPWWCARFGLNSGDKDESGMAPPSESSFPTSTPHQVALMRAGYSAQGCGQGRLAAVGRALQCVCRWWRLGSPVHLRGDTRRLW